MAPVWMEKGHVCFVAFSFRGPGQHILHPVIHPSLIILFGPGAKWQLCVEHCPWMSKGDLFVCFFGVFSGSLAPGIPFEEFLFLSVCVFLFL